jgi:DNA-binding transcriptional MocR family regulator
MKKKKELLAERSRIFEEYFPEISAGCPNSFYRWLPLPPESLLAGMEGTRCEGFLQTAGIRVCHSDRFRAGQDDGDRFLRISLSAASTPQLRAGLQILKRELAR